MNLREHIEKDLGAAFEKLGLDKTAAGISVSTIDICDYQCNACFTLGKELKTPPLVLAKQIADTFKSKVAACEAVFPAFLNFRVLDTALFSEAERIIKTGKLPILKQKQRTIFFDYGGANIAKELHVGHLRSPIVGEALKRVFRSLGHKTIADVYLGDWGLQNGLILAELESEGFIKNGKFIKEISLDILNEVYPHASRKKDTDKAFKSRADQFTLSVQQKRQPWFSLWQQLRETSVTKIRSNYDKLNCTFDLYNGESNAQPYVETVLDILKKKNLTYEDNNSLIMPVARENETAPMPPVILKKYNGGDLYATNDIATLYYRTKDYNPDEFIYLTDARQSLHFEQVFRCVKMGGIVSENTKLTHIGYGTMNGFDGKPFKTRAGGTIKLEEVIALVTEAAQKKLDENAAQRENKQIQSQIQSDNSLKIGLAALKFADLSNNVRKDYVFDIDKFTSFEGKTGPYILYTITRINSIFKKAEAQISPQIFQDSKSKEQFNENNNIRNLIIKTLKLADSYAMAASNYTLNGIADAAWALAAEFNLFYANTSIIREPNAETQQTYLGLCSMVRIALKKALHTLAIDTVEEM